MGGETSLKTTHQQRQSGNAPCEFAAAQILTVNFEDVFSDHLNNLGALEFGS